MDWIEVKKDKIHQKDGCIWVKCVAEIKDNKTGEIRAYETDEILEIGDKYPSPFSWEENNYSCDCNRHMFFKRAKGETIEEDWEVECTWGKFSVNLKNKKNGEIYYREYDN